MGVVHLEEPRRIPKRQAARGAKAVVNKGHFTFTSTLSATSGITGACTLSASSAMTL